MSREQLTDQQADMGVAAPEIAATSQTYRLPPPLYAQVMKMGPGDAAALAELLAQHPDWSQQILSVAAHHMGNAAVQRAIAASNGQGQAGAGPKPPLTQAELHEIMDEPAPAAMGFAATGPAAAGPKRPLTQAELHEIMDEPAPAAAGPAAAGPKHPLTQAELHEIMDEPAPAAPAATGPAAAGPKHPLTQAELHEIMDEPRPAGAGPKHPLTQAELHEIMDEPRPAAAGPKHPLTQAELHEIMDEPAPAAKPAESAWVAGARAYNLAHADLVAEFDAATAQSCRGADGRLDPQAVATWQAQHGVPPDGRVGPHTLAAARRSAATAGELEESAAIGHATE